MKPKAPLCFFECVRERRGGEEDVCLAKSGRTQQKQQIAVKFYLFAFIFSNLYLSQLAREEPFFFVVSTITYRGRICTQCRPKALYLIGMDGGHPQP